MPCAPEMPPQGPDFTSVSCLVALPSPFTILFYVDSGAGQSMCSCPDAFLSLRPCAIEVIGVSGALPIFGIGTAMFVVSTAIQSHVVVLIHNCLLSQGSSFNLLSVPQFQDMAPNSVDFSVGGPSLSIHSPKGKVVVPLVVHEGLYGFQAEPLHPNDGRYRSLPRLHLTARASSFSPVTPAFALLDGEPPPLPTLPVAPPLMLLDGSSLPVLPSSTLGPWSCKLLYSLRNSHRILAFPSGTSLDFDAELQSFCDGFLAPVASPPARQTYDPGNPLHMADLSARFMGAGDERLRRTIELNRGLSPATGRVPVHPFPQGRFVQGKTPKGKVHHLNRASICEIVFTDTFETGDRRFRYGQAFVDYRSRWGDVIPLRSRTQVGWAFGEFCCRNFTPLI
jgi:hypothetical protein